MNPSNTPNVRAASFSRRRAWRSRSGHQRFTPEHLLKVLLDEAKAWRPI